MTEELTDEQLLASRDPRLLSIDKQTAVLVVGSGPLALEVGKNLALMGIRKIHLLVGKEKEKEKEKEGSLFMPLSELSQLNPFINLQIIEEPFGVEIVKNFTVVIFTESSFSELMNINESIRNQVKVIGCMVKGITGAILVDAGEKDWTFVDETGFPTILCPLISVKETSRDDTKITLRIEAKRELSYKVGDNLKFSGLDKYWINNQVVRVEIHEEMEEKHCYDVTFQFPSSSSSSSKEYAVLNDVFIGTNSVISKLTPTATIQHVSFKSVIEKECPENVGPFVRNKNKVILKCFEAVDLFEKERGHLPRPHHVEDAQLFVTSYFKSVFSNSTEDQIEFATSFSYTCQGQICPVNSIFGSVAANEALKFCIARERPLSQTLTKEFLDYLTSNLPLPQDEIVIEKGYERYEGQIKVFGMKVQKELEKMNLFVVGAGALGCEEVKNYSMMGIGKLIITDMDTVSYSNLQRQFLFRQEDVNKLKSEVVGKRAKLINDKIQVDTYSTPVKEDNCQNLYNEDFWIKNKIDCIVSAVDNIDARSTLLRLAKIYHLPMLDAGLAGGSGNTNTVIPGLTCSTSEFDNSNSSNSNQATIPVCTIKNRPYTIDHIIPWSLFYVDKIINPYYSSENEIENEKEDNDNVNDESLKSYEEFQLLLDNYKMNKIDSVQTSHQVFQFLFQHEIEIVQKRYPPNYKTQEGLYWALPYSFPSVISYDENNPDHPSMIKTIQSILETQKSKGFPKEDFEKDDKNQLKFVHLATKLRSQNYHIPFQLTISEIHQKAGKIMHILASSNHVTSSLSNLEIFKVVNQRIYDEKVKYFNWSVNMTRTSIDKRETPPIPQNYWSWVNVQCKRHHTFEDINTLLSLIHQNAKDKGNLNEDGSTQIEPNGHFEWKEMKITWKEFNHSSLPSQACFIFGSFVPECYYELSSGQTQPLSDLWKNHSNFSFVVEDEKYGYFFLVQVTE